MGKETCSADFMFFDSLWLSAVTAAGRQFAVVDVVRTTIHQDWKHKQPMLTNHIYCGRHEVSPP